MQALFNIINIPLGYILRFLSTLLGGNFAAAVFAFTLLINLVLLPLTIKSQKSAVGQLRVKPKLDELKKRYGDDRQKFAEAQQKLYQEENISMSGGCLPMIIRLALMMSIYWLILSPLTYMVGVEKAKVENVQKTITTAMSDLKKEDADKYEKISKELSWKDKNNTELPLVHLLNENEDAISEILSKKEYNKIKDDLADIKERKAEADIDFTLFGIDLTETPDFNIDIFNKWQKIWWIPICAFLAQMLTSVISMFVQKKQNPDVPSMAGMMLTMPLISLFIGFGLPGGVGFYWICSSLVGGLIQPIVQIFYGPQKLLAKERAGELVKRVDFEAKQIKN